LIDEMLYKDFGNLPYGSLCVSSIVKRDVSHRHMIAKDFGRCVQLMVAVRTRRGNVRIGPGEGSVISAFFAEPTPSVAPACARCHWMHRAIGGDGGNDASVLAQRS
jgi:hypothetical protein